MDLTDMCFILYIQSISIIWGLIVNIIGKVSRAWHHHVQLPLPSHYEVRTNLFSRLKSSMPFKCDLALQNILFSKQPFKTLSQIENEDVTWSLQCNMVHILLSTRTNRHRALSIQVELDGWFLVLHIVLTTCIIYFMHKFNMNFVCRFYILGLTSWIWTSSSTERPKFWEPFKMKLIWGLQP